MGVQPKTLSGCFVIPRQSLNSVRSSRQESERGALVGGFMVTSKYKEVIHNATS